VLLANDQAVTNDIGIYLTSMPLNWVTISRISNDWGQGSDLQDLIAGISCDRNIFPPDGRTHNPLKIAGKGMLARKGLRIGSFLTTTRTFHSSSHLFVVVPPIMEVSLLSTVIGKK